MQVFLSVAPEHCRDAMKHHSRLAHAAYHIGEGSRLLRQKFPVPIQGGILSLSDRAAPHIAHPDWLCRDLWQECVQRGYGAVLADFEEPPTADRLAFLSQLCTLLRRNNRRLFLPENLAMQIKGATAVICTALSGGTLKERLEEAAKRFGPGQTALDIQRLAMVFPLPCPSGQGKPLQREELAKLMAEQQPLSFYSADLAAKYFTYARDGRHHFVLYDDIQTMQKKIRLGHNMGFPAAFLMYPEVEDLLPALFSK